MISNEMDPLVVNSGAAALDLIARQSGTLDMILMDITLGDMDVQIIPTDPARITSGPACATRTSSHIPRR